MDPFVDSGYLSTAFAVLRNYIRSRRRSVQFLEELVRNQTGRASDSFPEIAFLLSAVSEDVVKIEDGLNETVAKGLDHDITVKLESVKEQVLRLSRAEERPAAGEVLVPVANEDCERVRIRRTASPKKVTFSPDVRSAPLTPRTSAAKCTGVSAYGVARVPIVVTAANPKIGDLDCLICQQMFLKRQSLIEHVTSLHKVSSRLHDVLFQTLTSKSESDLCCITCNRTFPTRKLAFRHSRDHHTENYNTFIKIMAMTGSLKQFHSFFMNLDKDTPDEPADDKVTAAATSSNGKGRRRSRLTAPDSADANRSLLLNSSSFTPERSATGSSQIPDQKSLQSGPHTVALRPSLKVNKEANRLSQSHGDGNRASQPSDTSSPNGAAMSAKKGRGRPPKSSLPSEAADRTTSELNAKTRLTVPEVSVSFPIHNLRNREPVEYNPASLSAPLDSELDSSSSSAAPQASECKKCGKTFINPFELGLHQLKSCKYRKPVALSGQKTRFAMKSTKPALDSAQENLIEFYAKSRASTKAAASGASESPSKSGVQLDMGQRKRKCG